MASEHPYVPLSVTSSSPCLTDKDRIPTVNNKAKYKLRTREANWSKFASKIKKKLSSRYQRNYLNKTLPL